MKENLGETVLASEVSPTQKPEKINKKRWISLSSMNNIRKNREKVRP